MSEHGIYLRERYLSYLQDERTARGEGAGPQLLPGARRRRVPDRRRAGAALDYNRRWQLQNGADPGRMWTMYNGVAPGRVPARRVRARRADRGVHGPGRPAQGPAHVDPRVRRGPGARCPDARLRIFGGTPPGNESYQDSCRELIDDLGLDRRRHPGGSGGLSRSTPTTPVRRRAHQHLGGLSVHGRRGDGLRAAGRVHQRRRRRRGGRRRRARGAAARPRRGRRGLRRLLTEDAPRRRMASTARERVARAASPCRTRWTRTGGCTATSRAGAAGPGTRDGHRGRPRFVAGRR